MLFDQAFRIFFRKRGYIEKLIASMLPETLPRPRRSRRRRARSASRRRCSPALDDAREDEPEVEIDARLTVSDREVLQKKDFAQMSAAEIAAAKAGDRAAGAAARRGAHAAAARRSRHGHLIDIRRTLRASMKAGGAVIDLKYLGPRVKEPPIVALLDISGSMSQYTRLFLHFLHAITDARKRVTTFLFGTRLTNVTRAIRAARSGRGARRLLGACGRLVGRHAHRHLAARLQQAMGAPRAGAGRGGAADHRRA